MNVFEQIRASCASVAARAQWVTIDQQRLAQYATEIAPLVLAVDDDDPGRVGFGDDETTASFVIALDAVNFGSGYFPHLHKRAGMSGYHTVATSLREHVAEHGALRADQLAHTTTEQCAAIFGQPIDDSPATELMALFAAAWRELGQLVIARHNGTFVELVRSCEQSAANLVRELDRLVFFHDVAQYCGCDVLLYKRAQITANDLALTFGDEELGRFDDLDKLTMFPDNLVPHVLRVDGVLRFAPELIERINRVDDIASGSEPEVEIRAVGLHAVELLTSALADAGVAAHARDLDTFLWNRGGQAAYKAVPRHRTRCVYY